MARTTGVDVILAAFRSLGVEEQEEAYRVVAQERVMRLAQAETAASRQLAAIVRVAELIGQEPSVDDYKRVRLELRERGEDLPEINAIIRAWTSWSRAKEAAHLSKQGLTVKLIEARFASRRLGKVHVYTEQTLKETMARCAEDLGGVPPLVADYKAWRDREHALAKAQGRELHLPSDSPFRGRWGSWPGALAACGFSPADYAAQLEAGRERSLAALKHFY